MTPTEAIRRVAAQLDRVCGLAERHAAECAACADEQWCEVGRDCRAQVDGLLSELNEAAEAIDEIVSSDRWAPHSDRWEPA